MKPQLERTRSVELGALSTARMVSNIALRWVGPFLPTLERAFGASTGTMTGIMGVAELGGLGTLATGPALDRGHERRIFLLGMVGVAASSIIALGGSITTFAISYAILVIGVGNATVAGHTWIGNRVPFAERGRSIGIFETSWAISLLVGAPIIAVLIRWFGWRGPYLFLTVASAAVVVLVRYVVTKSPRRPRTTESAPKNPLPRSAWPPMIASAATAATGLSVFIVSGAWLDEAYGVSTAGLGLIAAGFGAIELVSSSTVALAGDRIGSSRSVVIGMLSVAAGLSTMLLADTSRTIAIAGLMIFLAGFEFALVSSLTLVTEAAPDARGRAIGVSNAVSTIARAGSVVVSGQLFESFGMTGPVALASATGLIALASALAAMNRST